LKSLNQIIAELEAFATAHYQIHAFGHGDVWEISPQSDRIVYPLLWMVPQTATPTLHEVSQTFTVLCMDLVDSGERNETEVLSDTQRIILDVCTYYRQQHGQNYVIEFGGAVTPFTEAHPERVSGNSINITIRQPFDYNACAIPADPIAPALPPCLPATFTLVNTATPDPDVLQTGSIAAGGSETIVAPPVTVLRDGQPFAVVPSSETVDVPSDCQPCAPVDVTVNSAPFASVPSGDPLDVPVVNGGSNPVGSEQGGDWVIGNSEVFINAVQVADIVAEDPANLAVELDGVPSGVWNAGTQTWEVTSVPCPNGSVEINGDQVATVASGGMVNIMVEQDGNPVGAFDPNSNSWVIPPCGAGGSVSVAVSDATPDFGDIITITATPTGFTPNNYLFFSYDGVSIQKIAEQASGVYSWTVDRIGAHDIYAVATDGTVRSWGKVGVVANDVFQAETTAFMNAVGIAPDFTVYYSSTIYQRTGFQLWVAVDNLVIALKAIGWAKFKGVWVYVGGTDSRHKWNIINPLDTNAAFRQVFFGGWTHGPTGAQPNGVNAYANTFLAPNGNQSLTSGHFSIYSRTVAASTDANGCSGVRDGVVVASYLVIRRSSDNGSYASMWGENTNDFTPIVTSTDGRGFYMGSRTSSSSLILQKNGTTISSVSGPQTASALSNESYFLSAANLAGSPFATTYDNKEIAFASIGAGLTASEGLTLYNAVQAYQSALNRAV
jgi:hypothetical protein